MAMTKKKPSQAGEASHERFATPAEIQAAYEALTPAESLRLRNYAQRRIKGLGRKAAGRTAEGLLQEALTATLEEKRHWKNENVDFAQYLKGAITSISSNWRAKFDRREAQLGLGDGAEITEVSLEVGENESEIQIASPAPDQQRVLEAKETVEQILRIAGDHLYASAILDEMLLGLTGPETQRKLGITKTEYETTLKWIRRNTQLLQ
jgi:flagellar hook-basal body complex protein FliE